MRVLADAGDFTYGSNSFVRLAEGSNMSWRTLVCILSFLAFSRGAGAQQKIDCTKIYSAGCTSFNELLAAQDGDITDTIKGDGQAARVCFVDGEDTFLLLSFQLPRDTMWRKKANGVGYDNGPWIATLKKYK